MKEVEIAEKNKILEIRSGSSYRISFRSSKSRTS